MSDEPITLATLARFHREVVLPDIAARLDAIRARFERLDTECVYLKMGLARIEVRLDRSHGRSDVAALRVRVDSLQAQLRTLDRALRPAPQRGPTISAAAGRPPDAARDVAG